MCLAHDQLMLCSCYELSCQETNYINNCTNYVFIYQHVFVFSFKRFKVSLFCYKHFQVPQFPFFQNPNWR